MRTSYILRRFFYMQWTQLRILPDYMVPVCIFLLKKNYLSLDVTGCEFRANFYYTEQTK